MIFQKSLTYLSFNNLISKMGMLLVLLMYSIVMIK